jgi:predicted nucleic acid-binding protein
VRRLFVDTAAWIALLDVSDERHQDAMRFWNEFKARPVRFITSDYVLDEAYTHLRLSLGLRAAVALHDFVQGSRAITVVEVGKGVCQDAWEVFVRYSDKEWSFTDCTSFALMRRLGLGEVFTFDDDFRQMGYVVQP